MLAVLYKPVLDITQGGELHAAWRDETEVRAAVTLSSFWRISHMGRGTGTKDREKGARLWQRDEMRGWTTPSLIFQFSHFLHLNGREGAPCVLPRTPPTPPSLSSTQRSLHLAPLRNWGGEGGWHAWGVPGDVGAADSHRIVKGSVFKAGRRMKIWQQKLLYRFWII